MSSSVTIIVHGLEHARAAVTAARHWGVAVRLASAPGAAAYLGPALFQAMVEQARLEVPGVEVTAVLDCGGDPGLALAAFRQGLRAVRVALSPEVRARVADIAAGQGAVLVDEPGPTLDLLDETDPHRACWTWLEALRGNGAWAKERP